ncbi:MAG: lipoyl(octanoyl) transferase LipB [Actinobacteria bacterium]|nr:MAG: lipoyl(octanoyl) transferase LipB [Actinomycetota bacterium]
MPVPAWLIRPGTVPYDVANAAMHRLAERRLAGEIPDTVILLEHPPVFTAGRRAKIDELLWSPDEVEARGGLVRMIDRGGSFTYHGPGQLVGYPILGLGSRPDAVDYLRRLEEAVIGICADVGVATERRADVQTGVWVGDDKICAIGVRLMRARVTLHGFALNCETDLSWFRGIVACGLPGHGQTSLSDRLGRRVAVADVLPFAERHLAEVFDLSFEPAPGEILSPFQVADAV